MSVVLINRTGRMKVFTLAHDTYCEPRGVCSCGVSRLTGRRVARSLTLPAAQRSAALPEAVLEVTDILRATTSGELGVERSKRKRKRPAPLNTDEAASDLAVGHDTPVDEAGK